MLRKFLSKWYYNSLFCGVAELNIFFPTKGKQAFGTAPWTNFLLLLITTNLTILLSYFIKCSLVLRYQHVLDSQVVISWLSLAAGKYVSD